MTTAKLIRLLGTSRIAQTIGVSAGAVRNWTLEGRKIPWKHRVAISKMAKKDAIALPEGFWE